MHKPLIPLDGSEPLSENTKKGLIIFFIFHYFIFWFLVAVIRTIITDPGTVP